MKKNPGGGLGAPRHRRQKLDLISPRSSTTFITRVRHALTHPARCGGAQDTTHTGAPYPAFTIGLTEPLPALLVLSHIPNILCVSLVVVADVVEDHEQDVGLSAVSYTHLTLPTIYSV